MKRKEHIVENGIELKWCGRCKRWLPLTNFASNRAKWDGLQERCTECRKNHWSEVGQFTRTVPSPDIRKHRHRVQTIKSYGITEEDFNIMLEKQENKCAICKDTDWGRFSPCIDHNHTTGKVRGLLCNRCNRVLGLVNESISTLKAMIKYLEDNEREEN